MSEPDRPAPKSPLPVPLADRAMFATGVSFTITDPRQAGNPLVWVNPAFTETTGYTAEEVIGRNCRFLQGADTDPRVIAEIRECLRQGGSLTTTLLNYRKDGTEFWNELSLSPVCDEAGTVTHFVGVQADVTSRVEAQLARDEALTRAASAADRLALLADFTSQMATSRQPRRILEMFLGAMVPRVATWGIVYTFEDGGRLAPPVVHHERDRADPAVAADLAALVAVVPEQLQPTSPIWRVLDGSADHVLISDYDGEAQDVTGSAEDDRTSLMHKLGLRSIVVVPLIARSGILGCIALIADHSRPQLGTSELELMRDLCSRAGLMLENAQLYAHQRAAAATLQRSLLPRLPRIPGIDVAARYVPSVDEAAVGGDWYDVFPLRGDGGVGVVVGDVMGHNYDSAARMGKLSTIVRAYTWPGSEPQVVLTAIDELVASSGGLDLLATCMLGVLHLDGGGATLRYSSAGHPPAIVRLPDGSTATLEQGRGPMIGIARLMHGGLGRPEDAELRLPSGSTLICFTDGLCDAYTPDGDIDAGIAELRRITESMAAAASPREVVERLTEGTEQAKDDVALLAIRIC